MKKVFSLVLITGFFATTIFIYRAIAQLEPKAGSDSAVKTSYGGEPESNNAVTVRNATQEENATEEEAVTEEKPAAYPKGQQELFEPRDSSPRLNAYTGQYEQATPNEELRYNPMTGGWSYASPNATLQYNSQTGQWEYSDKRLP